MFESLSNEAPDLRSSHTNGVKVENSPEIGDAFIQNGVVLKLSSNDFNHNSSASVDTDEIVDENYCYENDEEYDEYYYDDEEEEEEDEEENYYD